MRPTRRYIVLASTVAALACGNEPAAPTGAPSSRLGSVARVELSDSASVIHALAEGFARLSEDSSFKQMVFREIAASSYVEGRVPLRRIMASGEYPYEMEKLRVAAGLAGSLPDALPLLPELELYFPFEQHRLAWTPDKPFLVAVPYEGRDSFRLISAGGSSSNVKVGTEPSVHTFVLGPSEIDFDDTASALVGGSRTGDALATRRSLFLPAGFVSAGFETLISEVAWRMSYIRVLQQHDGGLAGNDEAETFGYWGDNAGGLSSPYCARYTGLNTGNGGWILEEHRDRFTLWVPLTCSWCNWGIYVTAYEDDSQGCVLTSSDDFYGNITSYAPVPVNTVQRFIRWGSPGHIEEAWEPQYR